MNKTNYYIKLAIVNLITFTRVIGSIIMPISYFNHGVDSLVIFIPLLFFTDLIDGKLSRYWKVESFLGCILDAMSDKLFGFVMIAMLSYYYKAMFMVLLLEFIIFVLNMLAFKENKNVQSSKLGKAKTMILDVSIIFMYFYIGRPLYEGYISLSFNNLLMTYQDHINFILIGIMIGIQLITLCDYKKKSLSQVSYEKFKYTNLKSTKEIIFMLTDRDFYINNKNKRLRELLYNNKRTLT